MKILNINALLLTLLVLVAAIVNCVSSFASAQSATVNKLWETTLPSSTVTGTQLPIWIQPQSASFTFQGGKLFAVTTVDGALNMINASNGALLWRQFVSPSSPAPSALLQRSCGGNENGLFISQNGIVIALFPFTGETMWTTTLQVAGFQDSAQLYLYDDLIIVNDDTSIAAVSTRNGQIVWAQKNMCTSPCAYSVDNVGQSGRVGYLSTIGGAPAVVVLDKAGNVVLKNAFPTFASPYLANVDSDSFTIINLQNPEIIVRYPKFTITNFSDASQGEYIAGYSLACPQVGGGQHCGTNGKLGYTTLFINTNFRTYSFDLTTGLTNAASAGHPHVDFHLVAFAEVVSISETVNNGADTRLYGYNWKSMELVSNITLGGVLPYNLRLNWQNQMMAQTTTGFYFYQALSNQLNSDFVNAYPDGLVTANTVIDRDSFTITSGSVVASYSFTPSS